MSLKDLMVSDVANVFMQTDDFASSVKRLVGGDESNIKSITGIAGDDTAASAEDRGRGYSHVRMFDFAETSVLEERDAIKIGDLKYGIDSITDPVHGIRTAKLVRYQPETKGGKHLRSGDF